MGKQGENRVPVIDLRAFPGESKKLIEACEDWGCFRVVNYGHILAESLAKEMKEVVRALFELPPEMKMRNTHVLPGSGYVAPTVINPLYESFGVFDMFSPLDVEAFCSDLDASPHQRETMLNYAKGVHNLMMEIGRKLGEALGLKGDIFEGWPCLARINKYHFTPKSVGTSGVQIHTDAGFFTVLQDDDCVGGLEIMKKSGEFVAVDPWPGTLLLNLGDMAAVWSNGRFCNVRHRVMCREATTRISIASFLTGPGDAALGAPPEILGSNGRALYAPVSYEQLRKLRLDNDMLAGEVLALIRDGSHSSSKA